ncbi:MAG: signal peptidase II [Acidobacteria bacterium]|nr:signal peptidase II [Acidobacteriota bacterium]
MVRKYHLLIAFVIVAVDRLSKWLVSTHIPLHGTHEVFPGLFRLTHVQNRGAAFGLWSDSPSEWKVTMLILFSLAALLVVVALLWKSHSMTTTAAGLALILGGALGNLWDRLSMGYVVDFLDFSVSGYHWPAFNLADSAIVIGALLLVSEILFSKGNEAAEGELVGDR